MEPVTAIIATLEGSLAALASATLSPPIEVVATLHDARAAMVTVVDQLPDVLVLEGALLPGVTPLAVVSWLRTHAPATRVLLIAPDDDTAYQTLVSGAFSIVAPGELGGPDHLDALITACARGESHLGPHVAGRLVAALPGAAAADDVFGRIRLTAVEHEILSRIALGAPIEVIADDHDVTPRLVHLHLGYAVTKRQRHAEQRTEIEATAARPRVQPA